MQTLINALQNADLYEHPIDSFQVLETHASWIILTGQYAYKLKKSVDFGFLDFTTLEKRHFYCEEELRLNQRLAPALYLEVVALTGKPSQPELNGAGPVFEYALKMRQFSQDALLSELAARGALEAHHIDELARRTAAFHGQLPPAPAETTFGSPAQIQRYAAQNFEQMRPLLGHARYLEPLDRLQDWTKRQQTQRRQTFEARKRRGFIRECHGDLHLGNIALVDDRVTPFDCIEFNQELRWIDVMSEVAFVVMDLFDRDQRRLAFRFLDVYLQDTGDYTGLATLPYYLVYRALVRAKIDLLRLQQELTAQQTAAVLRDYQVYIDLASAFSRPSGAALIVTHGLSGTGKSSIATVLVEILGAIRIRSDVERKRLFGLAADASSNSPTRAGIYTAQASQRTYARLAKLATSVISTGYPVIIDAALLKRRERDVFRRLARHHGIPFVILDCQAPVELLYERIHDRQRKGQDASEASADVLTMQLRNREPLTAAEAAAAIVVDTTQTSPSAAFAELILARCRENPWSRESRCCDGV